MRNFNNVDSIYVKTLTTVSIKRSLEHVADPEGSVNKAESPSEIFEVLKTIYNQLDDDQEHLVILVLNLANAITGFKVISSGTQSSGPGDAKIIFRNALMLGASKVVLAHNHPSGSLKPSTADINFTQKMIEAGRVLDIPVVDHIIYTHSAYISMRADGICKFESFI